MRALLGMGFAAIIGFLRGRGGRVRRVVGNSSILISGASAAIFTVLSELLQNTWFALLYNVPTEGALAMAIQSMLAVLANNIVLLGTVGVKTVKLIRKLMTQSSR